MDFFPLAESSVVVPDPEPVFVPEDVFPEPPPEDVEPVLEGGKLVGVYVI